MCIIIIIIILKLPKNLQINNGLIFKNSLMVNEINSCMGDLQNDTILEQQLFNFMKLYISKHNRILLITIKLIVILTNTLKFKFIKNF